MLNNPTFIVELPNNIPYGNNPIATIPINYEIGRASCRERV